LGGRWGEAVGGLGWDGGLVLEGRFFFFFTGVDVWGVEGRCTRVRRTFLIILRPKIAKSPPCGATFKEGCAGNFVLCFHSCLRIEGGGLWDSAQGMGKSVGWGLLSKTFKRKVQIHGKKEN
jgi:hypothetical protein